MTDFSGFDKDLCQNGNTYAEKGRFCTVCDSGCEKDDDCNESLQCMMLEQPPTEAQLPGCQNLPENPGKRNYCYDSKYNTKKGNTCQPCTDMHPQCIECTQTNIPKQEPTCTKCKPGWHVFTGICVECGQAEICQFEAPVTKDASIDL